jgi:hypothetical protein
MYESTRLGKELIGALNRNASEPEVLETPLTQ